MKQEFSRRICQVVFLIAMVGIISIYASRWKDEQALLEQSAMLSSEKQEQEQQESEEFRLPTAGIAELIYEIDFSNVKPMEEPQILPEYRSLYEENQDLAGWLIIDDTVIDYPVMQTPEDEEYYLYKDFYKEKNSNGSLIMDSDSVIGTGSAKYFYLNGIRPSTNLIIHGHTMKSGQMFGNLKLYKDEAYGREHNIIRFDSLYEKREYELISVFYTQVFYENEDVFKYYKFFEAATEEEFDDWYKNIKEMSLYDTGVTAEMGDEFISLSCCAYHVEDGRFVVVGKRIL